MGWNAKERVAGGKFLDDYDGDSIAAGYTAGQLSAEQSGDGKMKTTHQLFVLWQPRGIDPETEEPYNAQPSWYSMGSKPYEFTGEKFTIEYGDGKTQECYPAVAENSPALIDSSKMGLLTARLDELKYEYGGAEAKTFVGIPAHLMREEYDPSGKKSDKEKKSKKGRDINPSEILMPTKIIEPLPKGAAPKAATKAAATTDDTELVEAILDNIAGKTDADLGAWVKEEKTQLLFPGLKLNAVFKAMKPFEASGKIGKDDKTKKYFVVVQ